MNTGHATAQPGSVYEHAYDPAAQGELFDGVRTRRMTAFVIDMVIIIALMVLASIVIAVLGILTFSLGWLLFALVWPFVAIGYIMFTLGGSRSATPGMRMSGLQMRTWYGAPMYPLLALAHAMLFWFSITLLTPFILLIALFNPRKRLVHDYVAGTVLVRTP
ncbi:MAG: RDD family protein [Alphaproteobacteria bacterium]